MLWIPFSNKLCPNFYGDSYISWCESQVEVNYVFGLAQNSRLLQLSQSIQYRASLKYSQKLQTKSVFLKPYLLRQKS